MTVKEALGLIAAGTPCRLVVQRPDSKFWTSQFAGDSGSLQAKLTSGAPDYLDAHVVCVDAVTGIGNYPYLVIFAKWGKK